MNSILDLAKRSDGYLALKNDPVVDDLFASGLVTLKSAGDGYVIIKAVPDRKSNDRRYDHRSVNGRWQSSYELGEMGA